MLSLQTRDSWAQASVAVTVGAATATWTCAATSTSAFDAMTDLTTWANAAARPWFGVALFDWAWARQSSTGGAVLRIRNGGGVFGYAANATAISLLGIAAGAGALEYVGTVAAAGTWSSGPGVAISLRMGVNWLKGQGEASGVGALRPGVPGLAPWLATCRPVVNAQECARLTSVLARAANPRRAWLRLSNVARSTEYIVPPDAAGWKLVAVGAISRNRQGASLWTIDLTISGEAV